MIAAVAALVAGCGEGLDPRPPAAETYSIQCIMTVTGTLDVVRAQRCEPAMADGAPVEMPGVFDVRVLRAGP